MRRSCRAFCLCLLTTGTFLDAELRADEPQPPSSEVPPPAPPPLLAPPTPPPIPVPAAPPGWTRDPVTGQWVQIPPPPSSYPPEIPPPVYPVAIPPPPPSYPPEIPPPVYPVAIPPAPAAPVVPAPNARPNRPFFADLELPLIDLPLLFLVQKDVVEYSLGLGFRGAVGGMIPHSQIGFGIGGSIHLGLRDSPKLRDYRVDVVLRKNNPTYITNIGFGVGIKTLVGTDGYTYGVVGFHAAFDVLPMVVRGFGVALGMDLGIYGNNGVTTMLLGFHIGPGVAIDRWSLDRSHP
jgi:hypothetical protein